MKKSSLIIGIVVGLIAMGAVVILYSGYLLPKEATETAITPQAQTERLTSFFLLRKIDRLRDRAVYLQHREEGRKLLELSGIMPSESSSAESSSDSSVSSPISNPTL